MDVSRVLSPPKSQRGPIIDILIVLDDVNDEDSFVPPLRNEGFVVRVREPGQRMMRTPVKEVHLPFNDSILTLTQSSTTSIFVTDCGCTPRTATPLRSDKARTGQPSIGDDMNYYAEAKSDVIIQILSRAGG